jgi:hypothetical protein
MNLTARAIKVTIVLDPKELAALPGFGTDGDGRAPFAITVNGRELTGALNPKSPRKVLRAIREGGPDGGKLGDGDAIDEAGITATPRKVAPNPCRAQFGTED